MKKKMILRKTDLDFRFFLEGTLFRAISKGIEVVNDQKNKKFIFCYSFPSKKAKLDINQDADNILTNLDAFSLPEFDDEYSTKSLSKLDVKSDIVEINV